MDSRLPDLSHLIKEQAATTEDNSLPIKAVEQISRQTGISPRQIELRALKDRIAPGRYLRNLSAFGWEGQARLLKSKAAIIGAGGLGGLIIELLARAGVGELVVVDPDTFTDNNLNRQFLCRQQDLGLLKVEAARDRVGEINSSTSVEPHPVFFKADNAPQLLEGCQVAIDALDSIQSRIILEKAAQKAQIPLIHGAIGGWMGQVAITMPGEKTFQRIYGTDTNDRGVETLLGTPTPVPAVIGALQALSAIRILLQLDTGLKNKLFLADLSCFSFSTLNLDSTVK